MEDMETEEKLTNTGSSYTSEWAKQMSEQLEKDAAEEDRMKRKKREQSKRKEIEEQKRLDEDKRLKDEEKKREKEKKKKENGMKALKRWFGNETSEDESSDNSDEEKWTDIERVKKNKDKKKKKEEERVIIERETLRKGKQILGLGPIGQDSIEYYMERGDNFEDAKKAAIGEFLNHYLGYSETETEELSIVETQMAGNGDEIVYAAFENEDDLKEIHYRTADCKNKDIELRTFIPPQLYERFIHLNKVCKDMREKNKELKTQIRFGLKDVEVFLKTKGSQEPYEKVPLEDITDTTKIPVFNHKLKWKKKYERPPRRKIQYQSECIIGPSLRKTHALSRENSNESQKQGTKRTRRDLQEQPRNEDNLNIHPTGRPEPENKQ